MFEAAYQHQSSGYGSPQTSGVFVVAVKSHHGHMKMIGVALGLLFATTLLGTLYKLPVRYQAYSLSSAHPSSAAALPSTPTKTPPPVTSTPAATPPDTQALLQAVINGWQNDYKSGHFGVVVKELGSQGVSAELNADEAMPAASLYKLYLAQYAYDKVDNGSLSLSATINTPHSVGECLQLMITLSDNTCADSMGSYFGWTTLTQAAKKAGFTETTLPPNNTTSARDITSFLEQLQAGALMSQASTQSLLANMKGQIYRSAIPAGVPGVPVADKVGFLGSTWDDAAIVYNPKGTYILVVLSQSSNPSAIKDLSARISKVIDQ